VNDGTEISRVALSSLMPGGFDLDPFIESDRLYALSNDDMVFAVDLTSRKTLWTATVGGVHRGLIEFEQPNPGLRRLSVQRGELLFSARAKAAYSIDGRGAHTNWSAVGEQFFSRSSFDSPLVVEDLVIVTDDGDVRAYRV